MIVKGSLPPARGGRSEKHVIEERRRRTTEKRAKVVKECCSGFELVKGGGGVGGLSGMTECLADLAGKEIQMWGWDGCHGAEGGCK